MKILVLNCGSSSVKFQLIDTANEQALIEGGVERIGLEAPLLKVKHPDGSKELIDLHIKDHKGAVSEILSAIADPEKGCIKSFDEIDAVGHRVVHGGEKFAESVLIDDEVKAMIRECYDVAPLHNPANMVGIEVMEELMPGKPQVAVFDTAFHQTMPPEAYMYAIPYSYYTRDNVRRYGFHGTSHRYVSQRVCEMLGVDIAKQRIITCHIGNGASITAIQGGKSIDTSMGLTPTEGLMMGTRVGDIDPGALIFLMQRYNLDAKQLQNLVNKESGVLGIYGRSSDMRDIEQGFLAGDAEATLALRMYERRVTKYIGAYAALMGGVDIIAFAGGVGENQMHIRRRILEPLEFLGVKVDVAVNEANHAQEGIISAPDSKVKVAVVPTNEELMIARDTAAIVAKL